MHAYMHLYIYTYTFKLYIYTHHDAQHGHAGLVVGLKVVDQLGLGGGGCISIVFIERKVRDCGVV